MAKTLISSTQFVVDPSGGKAKTSGSLVTQVIKGVFPVYLVTMGGRGYKFDVFRVS